MSLHIFLRWLYSTAVAHIVSAASPVYPLHLSCSLNVWRWPLETIHLWRLMQASDLGCHLNWLPCSGGRTFLKAFILFFSLFLVFIFINYSSLKVLNNKVQTSNFFFCCSHFSWQHVLFESTQHVIAYQANFFLACIALIIWACQWKMGLI